MLIDEQTELLIQRCVDDELSPPEMAGLLRRLDGLTDGWKCLACGLLEDRQLRRLLVDGRPGKPSAAPVHAVPSLSAPAALKGEAGVGVSRMKTARSWWNHPVTSLTLCAAIAFVGGLLIPDRETQRSEAGRPGIGAPSVASPGSAQSAMLASDNGPHQFRIQIPQSGQELAVPVYSALDQLVRENRQHPLFSRRKGSGEFQDGIVQWMVAPMDDDRFMFIPVTEDVVGRIQ